MSVKELMFASLIVFGSAFASQMPDFPASDHIRNVESCYQGIFSDLDTYTDHLRSLDGPNQEARAEAGARRYAYWQTNIECYWYDYTVDGLTVSGFIARPINQNQDDGPYPAVIFNHGGNADSGGIRDRYLFGKIFPYVAEGFVIAGSQYRGTTINGQPSPDRMKDEFGGQDVNDVLALVPILEDFDFVDSDRIGLWGVSRGAMMSFIAAKRSDRFSALVAEYSPTDLELGLKNRPEMARVFETWIPEFGTEQQSQALRDRSVIHWADELPDDMPILLLHGEQDQRVDVAHTERLAEELDRLNHPYKAVIYPDGTHGLRQQWRETKAEFTQFFTEHLAQTPDPAD